ncbi:major facilitator superfamily transporter [Apiospora aurea]|uniref:Major facilitator superfamily transporter n=1 Tax=Apiospora aurea TaxID=335848 RepID=A0ABR1QPF1_9PEZI
MPSLGRILSRPTAKPYRTRHLAAEEKPYLNADGHVDFAPGDVENPHNWSTARRWYCTCTAASSGPSGCFPSISEHFGVSEEAAGLTITLFLLGYCAGPLLFAPLSEFYGRRWIFYITFLLYLAFNFLCAFAPNFGSLLVGRFLTGTFVSAPLSNGPGVLADLWNPVERGTPWRRFLVWFGLKEDWRWIFYVLLWFGAGTAILMFTLPETFGPMILKTKARRIRAAKLPGYQDVKAPVEDTDRSLLRIYKIALTRPWIILFDTISLLCAVYMSIVYTLLYMLFSIYPIVFQQRRGWNAGVGELPLVGTVVGSLLGAIVVVVDSKKKARRVARGEKLEPEDRLPIAMIGGIGFAVTMFWFAWTAEFDSIHWIVPTIAGVFLASSLMLIFVGYLNYLVRGFRHRGQHGVSVGLWCGRTVVHEPNVHSPRHRRRRLLNRRRRDHPGRDPVCLLQVRQADPAAVQVRADRRSRRADRGGKPDDEERQRRHTNGSSAALSPPPLRRLPMRERDRDFSVISSSSEESTVVVGVGGRRDHAEEGREREKRIEEMKKQRRAEERPQHTGRGEDGDDNLQNSLGEPRDENVNFGKEAV